MECSYSSALKIVPEPFCLESLCEFWQFEKYPEKTIIKVN